ncbi:MAG: hypothetical protein V3U57_06530 [Robiginitomaculum sp.]
MRYLDTFSPYLDDEPIASFFDDLGMRSGLSIFIALALNLGVLWILQAQVKAPNPLQAHHIVTRLMKSGLNFELPDPQMSRTVDVQIVTMPEPEPKPIVEAKKLLPKPKPKSRQKPKSKPKPKLKPQPQPKPKAIPETEPVPDAVILPPEIIAQPALEPKISQPVRIIEPEPVPEPEPEPEIIIYEPAPDPIVEPVIEPEPISEPIPEPIIEALPEPLPLREPLVIEPEPEPLPDLVIEPEPLAIIPRPLPEMLPTPQPVPQPVVEPAAESIKPEIIKPTMPVSEPAIITTAPIILASPDAPTSEIEQKRAIQQPQATVIDPITGRPDPPPSSPSGGGGNEGSIPIGGGARRPNPGAGGKWTLTPGSYGQGSAGGKGIVMDIQCRGLDRTHLDCPEYVQKHTGRAANGYENFAPHTPLGTSTAHTPRGTALGSQESPSIGGSRSTLSAVDPTSPGSDRPSESVLDDAGFGRLYRGTDLSLGEPKKRLSDLFSGKPSWMLDGNGTLSPPPPGTKDDEEKQDMGLIILKPRQ